MTREKVYPFSEEAVAASERYDGYLKPYVPQIVRLYRRGKSPREIARALYAGGARGGLSNFLSDPLSPAQHVATMSGIIVDCVLRLSKREKYWRAEDIERLQRNVAFFEDKLARARETLEEAKRAVAAKTH